MAKKPTYEELAQRVKELEREPVRDSKTGYAHVWSTYSQNPIPNMSHLFYPLRLCAFARG